jgi:hypothetical protein
MCVPFLALTTVLFVAIADEDGQSSMEAFLPFASSFVNFSKSLGAS